MAAHSPSLAGSRCEPLPNRSGHGDAPGTLAVTRRFSGWRLQNHDGVWRRHRSSVPCRVAACLHERRANVKSRNLGERRPRQKKKRCCKRFNVCAACNAMRRGVMQCTAMHFAWARCVSQADVSELVATHLCMCSPQPTAAVCLARVRHSAFGVRRPPALHILLRTANCCSDGSQRRQRRRERTLVSTTDQLHADIVSHRSASQGQRASERADIGLACQGRQVVPLVQCLCWVCHSLRNFQPSLSEGRAQRN